MKKIAAVTAALLGVCILLTACGRSDDAKEVDAMIRSLSRVSLESGEELSQVRSAYDALPDAEKAQVRQYEKLEEAEETYRNFVQINADIAQMIELSGAQFSNAEAGVTDLIERASEIRAAYEKMSAFEKAQIKDIDRMGAAIEKLQSYVQNAETAAAAYVKGFLTAYAGKGYTVTGIYCIKNIRDGGTEYHFFALTYEDAAGKTYETYSTARCTAEVTYDVIAARPEIFFAEEPVASSADALHNGNVTLDLEKILEMAAA